MVGCSHGRVCSHNGEVEFDSQHARTNVTSKCQKISSVQSSNYFDSASTFGWSFYSVVDVAPLTSASDYFDSVESTSALGWPVGRYTPLSTSNSPSSTVGRCCPPES